MTNRLRTDPLPPACDGAVPRGATAGARRKASARHRSRLTGPGTERFGLEFSDTGLDPVNKTKGSLDRAVDQGTVHVMRVCLKSLWGRSPLPKPRKNDASIVQ